MPPLRHARIAAQVRLATAALLACSTLRGAVADPPPMADARVETYKTVGDTRLDLWLFAPANDTAGRRPAIVFFFGGGWKRGSPRQFDPQCRHLAARGMVAITADYREESRQHAKPVDCVADARSAVRWVRANAGRLGIDPDRIAAAGGSAGGHIAACTAFITAFDDPGEDAGVSARPDALVLFNPALVLAPLPDLELAAEPLNAPAAGDEPLTTAAAIVGSTLATGDRPPPVVLEAIVTHRDATGTIFLRDATGATFIAVDADAPMLPAGERVRVEGVAHRGLLINGIRAARIERLGAGPRPEPKPVTPSQLAAGGLHYEWVAIEGVGRRWRTAQDGGGTLMVQVADDVVEARIERVAGDATLAEWIGARLRVQGIAAGEINDRRQLIRPYLLVPTADDVTVIEPAPEDPFAIPETKFSSLGRGEPSGRMQRVAGVAVAAACEQRLFVFDGEAGLCVGLADADEQAAAIRAGDRVEAVGFAEPGPFATRLGGARVRVVAAGRPVVPRRPSAAELRAGCDGQLVELEMTVVDRDDREAGTTLTCDAQGIPLRVVARRPLAAAIVPEATVRVTAPGLVTETTNLQYRLNAAAYDLFPERSADVVLIRRPTWWTARRLGLLLAASLAVGMLAVGWIVLLRRQVRRQMGVIEAQIQAEAVAEERRRIAREFHDSLEQDLSGLALRLDSAAGSMADAEARRVMERQREIVARLRDETREYVWNLRDPARLRGSLADRVASLLGELRELHAAPIALETTGPLPALPPETIHHLLQMLREAVSNAARHAQARRIDVRLRGEHGRVVASVGDDGIGFEPAGGAPAGHFGLRGLAERARRIGATVAVESQPGAGTTVTIRIPG